MKIQIHATHFHADQKLMALVEKKVEKLSIFLHKIVDGQVILSLDKGVHTKDDKVVTIHLHLPKEKIRVEKKSSTFEKALDDAIQVMRKKGIQYKEKFNSH